MRTVHKFDARLSDVVTEHLIPEGAKPLHVAVQFADSLTISAWFEVDTEAAPRPVRFSIVGTGHPIPDGASWYLGSVLMAGGQYVWHLYATWLGAS